MLAPFINYSEIVKDGNMAQWKMHRSLAWEAYRAASQIAKQTTETQIDIENQFSIWWGQYTGGDFR